ncbi:MAG: hypothetical protein ACTHNU_03130 [Gaiellales bacterium]
MGRVRVAAVVGVVAVAMAAVSVADAAVVGPHPITTWQANGTVTTTVISGNTIYLGGKFTAMLPSGSTGTGAVTRSHAAAIDLTTGQLLPWDPNVNNTVYAIAVSGSTVYLGGTFTHVGAAGRKNLAAVDAVSGTVIGGFHPPALNGGVMAIAPSPTGLYVGGAFTTVGAASRPYVAEFDPGSGAFMPGWVPVVDDQVRAIALSLDGSRVILGGDFNNLNGASSIAIGAVDPTSGGSLPWAWHGPLSFFRPFQVVALTVDSAGVYAAGTGNGGSFMRFDPATGSLIYIGGVNGNVVGVGVNNGILYLGGHFTAYCGLVPGNNFCTPVAMRDKLMAVDEATGALQTWHPSANKNLGIFSLAAGNGAVAVGGDFTRLGGVVQQGFGEFHE